MRPGVLHPKYTARLHESMSGPEGTSSRHVGLLVGCANVGTPAGPPRRAASIRLKASHAAPCTVEGFEFVTAHQVFHPIAPDGLPERGHALGSGGLEQAPLDLLSCP